MSRRTERIGSLIRNTIGQILLSKLSDPRIDPAKTSITHVEVPEDLLTAKVLVSVMGDEAQQRRTLRGLNCAAGHIQELMMRQVKLRHTPLLRFVADKQLKTALHTLELINQAMAEIENKEEARQPSADASGDTNTVEQ